jgi:hypothetical protein
MPLTKVEGPACHGRWRDLHVLLIYLRSWGSCGHYQNRHRMPLKEEPLSRLTPPLSLPIWPATWTFPVLVLLIVVILVLRPTPVLATTCSAVLLTLAEAHHRLRLGSART